MEVPVARRVGSPSWVNARTVLGLLLFCLAFLGGRQVLTEARSTVSVWAAARPLNAGTTIQPGDVELVDVRLPDRQLGIYVGGERPLEGAVLSRPVEAGELIPGGWLASGEGDEPGRTITVPVAPEHAVGGMLRAGDRVDVYATFQESDGGPCTTVLGAGLEVVDVVTAGGLVVEEEAAIGITVAVTPDEAAELALAIRTADIDVARVSGPPGATAASVCIEEVR